MAGRFSIDAIDLGPDDLAPQLPIEGQLLRFIAGPDRPDYFLGRLDRPIRHSTALEHLRAAGVDVTRTDPAFVVVGADGSAELAIHVLVMAARVTGQQVHRGMVRLPVNIAYVLSGAVLDAERLEFALCLPVAVGFASDRDPPDAT